MEFLYGLGIVGAGLLGFFIAAATSPNTIAVGTNDSESSDCDALCNQWDMRRQERCNAEADARAAQGRVAAATAFYTVLQVVAIAAWIAVGVAAAGFFTLVAVPVLTVVALIATAAAAAAAGALVDVLVDANQKERAAQQARQAEAEARSLLVQRCKDSAKLSTCLSRPAPC